MPRTPVPITSFVSGEWSPRLHGRIDIEKYRSACREIKNMIVWPHGGVTKRPGLRYIGDAKKPNGEVKNIRLIPFEFNIEQTYMLEFGDGYIRFFRDGGQIIDETQTPIEIATTFSVDELYEIGFSQTADIMYLVHKNHPPQKLSRTGPDEFNLSDVVFTSQPAEWGAENYPSIVTFYQQRLALSGCPKNPQTIWFSKSSSYEDFTSGSLDNESLAYTFAADQVNAIQWIISAKELIVGTTGGEWIFGANGGVLTPTNIDVNRQSKHGSRFQKALLIGNSAIYISRDKKKIREMQYSLEADAFTSPELSLLAEHIPRNKVKELAHLPSPDSIVWVLLEDGTFAGFTYLKDQSVIAWHTHETDGDVISISVIEEDEYAQIWMAVKRNNSILIETMELQYDGTEANDPNCFYVDSGLSYYDEQVAITDISGLDHLNDKFVQILADGKNIPTKKVVNGTLSLDKPAKNVIIGLPYEWRLTPLNIEGGSPSGVSVGKRKKINNLIVKVESTFQISCEINDKTVSVTPRQKRKYGEGPKLFTGDFEIKPPPNWQKEGKFTLHGSDPFPVKILMIVPETQANE